MHGSISIADVDEDRDQDLVITGEDNNVDPTATLYKNLAEGPVPVASQAELVGSDGMVNFGATGVDIAFGGTSGLGEVTVEKFDRAPADLGGITESNVSSYHYVVNRTRGDLTFGESTEVRLDVSTLAGVSDPSAVTIYRSGRTPGFSALSTTYDSDTNELVVETGRFSKFVLASDTEPLPVELANFEATRTKSGVRLTWRTASEQNNARRRDGSTLRTSSHLGNTRT